jgi:hypothetical protein
LARRGTNNVPFCASVIKNTIYCTMRSFGKELLRDSVPKCDLPESVVSRKFAMLKWDAKEARLTFGVDVRQMCAPGAIRCDHFE